MALLQPLIDELNVELKCYDISGKVLVIKEGDGPTVCKLKAPESRLSTVREVVDAANSTMLKVKKNHLSVQNEWIAFDCYGTVPFNILKKKFQKHTFISVSCSAGIDMGALWPHGPPVDPLRAAGLQASPPAQEVSLGSPLLMSSDRVASSLEGGAPQSWDEENMSEYGKFEIEGSWSGKDCVMRVKGSETIVAQMLPLDNNAGGFGVRVSRDINLRFVATCFAAVYAMKSESRKRKNAITAGGKMLVAPLLASGKWCYDCAAGGC